jgi:hypothetical protein
LLDAAGVLTETFVALLVAGQDCPATGPALLAKSLELLAASSGKLEMPAGIMEVAKKQAKNREEPLGSAFCGMGTSLLQQFMRPTAKSLCDPHDAI